MKTISQRERTGLWWIDILRNVIKQSPEVIILAGGPTIFSDDAHNSVGGPQKAVRSGTVLICLVIVIMLQHFFITVHVFCHNGFHHLRIFFFPQFVEILEKRVARGIAIGTNGQFHEIVGDTKSLSRGIELRERCQNIAIRMAPDG